MGVCTCRTLRGVWGRRVSKDQPGTWEVRRSESATMQRRAGTDNRPSGSGRKSAGFIVAWKRSNVRGAKGPCQIRATVRGRGNRLDPQGPTTDTQQPEADDHPLECRHGVLVLPTLALLRRKLSPKAKQELTTPCACRGQRYLGTPDAGNPHVRCDEGGGGAVAWHAVSESTNGETLTHWYAEAQTPSPLSLLYTFSVCEH